jgi:hypothetical protein
VDTVKTSVNGEFAGFVDGGMKMQASRKSEEEGKSVPAVQKFLWPRHRFTRHML